MRDPSSDSVFLRDDTNGDLWTATPCPIREPTPYRVRHGAGYSVFDHDHKGIASSLRLGVDQNDPVKISVLTLRNDSADRGRSSRSRGIWSGYSASRGRRPSTRYARSSTKKRSRCSRETISTRISPRRSRFASISERVAYYTADRREFLGRNGTISSPAALERAGLSGSIGATIDPCCALQVSVTLEPGEKRDIVMLLGAADSEDAVREIIGPPSHAGAAGRSVSLQYRCWEKRLATIKVRTPEPTFDLMVNRWSLYQALSCRMWARSALYQSSGAFGFRDQLQDVMAFVYADSATAQRAHS